MIVSGEQPRDSAVHVNVSTLPHPPPVQADTEQGAELPAVQQVLAGEPL